MKSGNFILSDFSVHDIVANITIPLNILTYVLYIGFKYPVDFRFITSGKYMLINTFSKFIGICLKHL